MIQGGDPEGTGRGGPGYKLKAEFNDTKHVKGILSMARAQDPDSAGSQFFIMHGDAPHLDNKYTAFGKVTEGLDVVDKIANTPVDENDKPLKPVIIKSIKIEVK
jgi:peptidyl-prolyl cis-trans isomerase B (cyclophilin B)